jgi:hypothetical protein
LPNKTSHTTLPAAYSSNEANQPDSDRVAMHQADIPTNDQCTPSESRRQRQSQIRLPWFSYHGVIVSLLSVTLGFLPLGQVNRAYGVQNGMFGQVKNSTGLLTQFVQINDITRGLFFLEAIELHNKVIVSYLIPTRINLLQIYVLTFKIVDAKIG